MAKKSKEEKAAAKAEKKKKKEEGGGGSSKGTMAVLFILGIVVISAAAFGGSFLFAKMNSNKNLGAEKQEVTEFAYLPVPQFTTNLADTGHKRYIKATLFLGYDSKDKNIKKIFEATAANPETDSNMIVIKDTITSFFKGKTAEYVNGDPQVVKDDLIEAINSNLQEGKVSDIRFTEFIVQ